MNLDIKAPNTVSLTLGLPFYSGLGIFFVLLYFLVFLNLLLLLLFFKLFFELKTPLPNG